MEKRQAYLEEEILLVKNQVVDIHSKMDLLLYHLTK